MSIFESDYDFYKFVIDKFTFSKIKISFQENIINMYILSIHIFYF